MPIRLGMNSYRMGHLTQKGGALEGQSFPVLSDSKAQYGEEEGTIRNLTLRYLTEVKKGQYQGLPQQRWKLVGMEGYEPQRAIVKSLLNQGIIRVPTTDDGRYTNVASINVKDALFSDAAGYNAALSSLEKQRGNSNDAMQKQRLQDRITLIKALNSF
ncbi:Uncharacterised protein [Serratia plymuthica]|nr:Uncharacterised protein [Serratia plymuthica]